MNKITPITLFFVIISINTLFNFIKSKPNIIYKCMKNIYNS